MRKRDYALMAGFLRGKDVHIARFLAQRAIAPELS